MEKLKNKYAIIAFVLIVLWLLYSKSCGRKDDGLFHSGSKLDSTSLVSDSSALNKTMQDSLSRTQGVDSHSGKTGSANGTTDANSGKTESANGKTDANSGKTSSSNGTTDANSGKTGSANGKTDANSGKTGSSNGTTDANSGKTGSANGTTDANSGKTGSANGTTDANSGKTGSASGKTDANSGKTGSANGTTDANSGKTGTTDANSGKTGSANGTTDANSGKTGSSKDGAVVAGAAGASGSSSSTESSSKGADNSSSSNGDIASDHSTSNEVFVVAEEAPTFPGGMDKIGKYVGENLKYPQAAKEGNIQGRVIVSFIIEKDGSVTNVNVIKGIGSGCDEEAVRVISGMPDWNAGKQGGKKVRVQYNLPITFRLD